MTCGGCLTILVIYPEGYTCHICGHPPQVPIYFTHITVSVFKMIYCVTIASFCIPGLHYAYIFLMPQVQYHIDEH